MGSAFTILVVVVVLALGFDYINGFHDTPNADATVTEGSSSTAWIVTKDAKLVTRPPSHRMLNGVTRLTLIRLAGEL